MLNKYQLLIIVKPLQIDFVSFDSTTSRLIFFYSATILILFIHTKV
jgi:hypothetical protein